MTHRTRVLQLLSAAEGDKNNKLDRRMAMLRTLLVTLQCAVGEGQARLDGDVGDASLEAAAGSRRRAVTGTKAVEAFVPRQPSVASDARASVALPATASHSDGRSSTQEIEAFVPVRCPANRRGCPYGVLTVCWFAFCIRCSCRKFGSVG